ncbi:MAG: hypothetical protein WC728_16365 [Elusimicrobiota bacterium]
MPEFFGRPVFIWFGVLALLSLGCTVVLGLNMRRFGLKAHKAAAYATAVLSVLHLALGAYSWLM